LAIGATLWFVYTQRDSSIFSEANEISSKISQELAAQFAAFEAKEQQVTDTVWAKEILAQECGRTFESLWDSLNAATNKLGVAASFPVGEIVLSKWSLPTERGSPDPQHPGTSERAAGQETRAPRSQLLPHGIELLQPAGPGPVLSVEAWRRFVEDFQRAGWQLAQTEFRHNRFDTDDAGQPRQSRLYFSAHLINPSRSERAILEGDLVVDWAKKRPDEEMVPVKRVDASALTIKTRQGEPAFRLVQSDQITPPPGRAAVADRTRAIQPRKTRNTPNSVSSVSSVVARSSAGRESSGPTPIPIDPLILYDLDGDGLSEIILPTVNLVYQRSRRGNEADAQGNPPPHPGG